MNTFNSILVIVFIALMIEVWIAVTFFLIGVVVDIIKDIWRGW